MTLPNDDALTPRDACVQSLLDYAVSRTRPDTVTFARLIGAKLASGELTHLGLPRDTLGALGIRHFPEAVHIGALPLEAFPEHPAATQHQPFVDDLRKLLLRHERPPIANAIDAWCLATIIANACLRPDHLWKDLGLDGRDDVTEILTRHYPKLVARNVDGLRWKRFLAQQVALDKGRTPGPAPGCPGCEDFDFCFRKT
ncbi:nitrogen fixation protein NifQ [Paraburkholderia rhizosphaerae]|uniref:Nitrogen fixation protein NifQ n=1 Tax=Paraburkholderia rhizosphaerae TaxID=480658 RepID=A0A4R8L6N7_9BURK|nr:nitrogen fixation protein NifQ [Paraburkholderia rhizosphaerae]TDY38293.1 nitrogen fixation protein NifQ [Paraburkholderia rhizosphaerae]